MSVLILYYAIHMGLVSASFAIQARPPDFSSSRPVHETIGTDMMPVPEEFRYLAHCYHQDITFFVSTQEEFVAYGLKCLQPAEKIIVKQFLTELLARNPDLEELHEMWNSVGPDWDFEGDDLRLFLTMIRDRITSESQ